MPSRKSKKPASPPSPWKAALSCAEPELARIARELAEELKAGDRVLLEGELGAGKTTFARALLAGLGVHQPPEGSPTFAIAHEYASPSGDVVHIDFYRLKSEAEIDDVGIPSYFWERSAIVICEWLSSFAEFRGQVLGSGRCFEVRFDFVADPARRKISINELAPSAR